MPTLYLPGGTSNRMGVRPTVRSFTNTSAVPGVARSSSFPACLPASSSSAFRFDSAGGGPLGVGRFGEVLFVASAGAAVFAGSLGAGNDGALIACTAAELFLLAAAASAMSWARRMLDVSPRQTANMATFQFSRIFCPRPRPSIPLRSPTAAQHHQLPSRTDAKVLIARLAPGAGAFLFRRPLCHVAEPIGEAQCILPVTACCALAKICWPCPLFE